MSIQQFLSDHGISYRSVPHQPTYEAQRLAQAVHVPGREVAKSVVLRADGEYLLAVLPAPHKVDLEAVKQLLGAGEVELATEPEIQQEFPDCEIGAVPPFGSQYGMRTLVDEALTKDEEILCESNTHEEALRMKFADYRELEKPTIARLSYHV